MRAGVSILGGLLLTLLLFALLAQLVVPPRTQPEPPEQINLVMTQASAQPQSSAPRPSASPTSEALPAPPEPAATPPPPAPAPLANSPIALPEPELPPREAPEVTLDAKLPELTEVEPEPTPEPEPPPEPRPGPEPTPQSQANAVAGASGNASFPNATASQEAASSDAAGASPRPTKRVPPEYPSSAQRRGIEGYVEMRFTIRADGSVDTGSIQVVAAKPRRMFEQAARQAIAGWEFPQADGPRAATQRLEFQLR